MVRVTKRPSRQINGPQVIFIIISIAVISCLEVHIKIFQELSSSYELKPLEWLY